MIHVKQASEGNKLQPNKWIDSYYSTLISYAITRVGHMDIAEDLVQETFLGGIETAHYYRGEAKEKTWLISILKRKIIDYYRRKNTKKRKNLILANEINPQMDFNWLEQKVANTSHEAIERNLDYPTFSDSLKTSIKKLPLRQEQVVALKTKGWGTTEICNELGMTETNLWVTLHRARKSLHNELSVFLD